MRTTITVDDTLFTDLMRLSGGKTRTEAINGALCDWVRRERIEKLRAMRGKLEIATDLDSLRRLEIDEAIPPHD